VGARKSSICYNAVERRKMKKEKKTNYENIKIIRNMIKLKYQKIIKISSYCPKIRVFSSVFRVFSYVF